MGTYKFYKLPFDGWADRISGTKALALHWQAVFEEHPEFFRLDGARERASLVWRRQYPKRFHVDEDRTLTRSELLALAPTQRNRLSRNPLGPSDLKTLIDTAISLHARAAEAARERRWWIPVSASFIGAIAGALIGALLKKGP